MNRQKLRRKWARFWMRWAGLTPFGRFASRLAVWGAPPYKARINMAAYHPEGYLSPKASVYHDALYRDRDVFIGDRVTIFQNKTGGAVTLHKGVHLYADIIIETDAGGEVVVGAETHVQPNCQFSAYVGSIHIGERVEIAPQCYFYPYNHGAEPGQPVRTQPLQSKGDIIIGDDAWLGVGVIVLDGVQIGAGAIIGAGSIVTQNIPAHATAVGAPARVIKMRTIDSNGSGERSKPHR
jgi:acetyltransferase-like isoleucine patch superfamily enzyme